MNVSAGLGRGTWLIRLFLLLGILFTQLAVAAEPLRVGLTGKYPPFNYYNESGELTGFDVEVAEALCTELGRPCEFRALQWDGILAALLAGKIDVIIGSMAITEERAKKVTFTTPYYESGAQLFVRPGAGDPEQQGFRIGVTLGTTYETFIREKFPRAEVRTYKGDPQVLQDIRAGRLDGMVTDKLVGAYLNRQHGAGLELSGKPLFLERIAIPVRPTESSLAESLNRGIARLRASPQYGELMEKYFGLGGKSGAARAHSFDWTKALGLMLKGLVATAQVAGLGVALGLLLSLFLAAGMIGLPGGLRAGLHFGVDFIRSTPFLVQLFAIYFGLPALGVRLGAWNSAVLAIAIHSAAYVSEVIKTAYQSVPRGQHQAATTLGLTRFETLKHVIWPQMLPVLTAPVLNTVVAMIKDSAIVSVISVHELTMQTQQLISATFRPMEFYAIAAALYFLITYPLLVFGRAQEKKYRQKGLLHGHA